MDSVDSILYMLPENEKNTVQAFLLMQHERIEALESLYTSLRDDIWSQKWRIKNVTEDQLIVLANAIYKDQIFYNCRYHQKTKNIFIKFHSIRCRAFVFEWVRRHITINLNDISPSEELVLETDWNQLWVLRAISE